MEQGLVDAADMVGSQMSFKRLSLTDIKIHIGRIPKKEVLIGSMDASGELSDLFLPVQSVTRSFSKLKH